MTKKYDVIGDVHGHLEKLINLLIKMGYKEINGVWQHKERIAVFVGDLIDRGPHQRELIQLVRVMCSHGSALCIMGNHEYNAVCYATEHPLNKGEYLRAHTERNLKTHQAFIDAYIDDREGYERDIAWMKELPLAVDLDGLRVIHACWHESLLALAQPWLLPGNILPDFAWALSADESHPLYRIIETLLKGPEIALDEAYSYSDSNGIVRSRMRIAWWQTENDSLKEIGVTTNSHRDILPGDVVPFDTINRYEYPSNVPVIFGHYWFTGEPALVMPNMACVDYGAGANGKLVAYRWDGESELLTDKFISSD